MDGDGFDQLTRGLSSTATRRSTLAGLAAFGLSGLVPWPANAKRKHHQKKKHHHKPEPFCAGKNYCDNTGAVCDPTGTVCGCLVTVETGEPFCGAGGRHADCSECTAEETCVELRGDFCGDSTGCALPCPNPL